MASATRVYTISSTSLDVGVFTTFNRDAAMDELFRIFGSAERYTIVESQHLDEWHETDSATHVYTIVYTPTGAGVFTTPSREEAYDEAFRIFGSADLFRVVESKFVDEWLDFNPPLVGGQDD